MADRQLGQVMMKRRIIWPGAIARAIVIGPVWLITCSLHWLSDHAQSVMDWLSNNMPAGAEWTGTYDEDYDL